MLCCCWHRSSASVVQRYIRWSAMLASHSCQYHCHLAMPVVAPRLRPIWYVYILNPVNFIEPKLKPKLIVGLPEFARTWDHIVLPFIIVMSSFWRHQEFSFGVITQGVWGRWSLGGSPTRGMGTKSPGRWSSLQILFTDFDCRNFQNLKISRNSPPDSWPICFTRG